MNVTRSSTRNVLMAATAVAGVFVGLQSAHGQAPNAVEVLPPVFVSAPVAVSVTNNSAMSLDQIIAAVLTSDPRLRVGNEEINKAAADAITASLRPNPTVGIGGQLIPLTRPFTVQEQGGPPQFDAAVSYPIDWFLFGKRKALMASAGIGVRQSESGYYDLIRLRVRDASVLYYDVMELKALRDLAQQDVESLARVEAVMKKAVANGARPEVDASYVSINLLRSQQLLRDAEVLLANAKSKLRAFLGRTDGDPSFDVTGSIDLPASIPVTTVDEAFAIAQENRPDLAALHHQVAKAEADTLVEHRKAFPGVAAKAGYSRQFQGSIGFRDADAFLVGIDVGLPIFDRNQGNRAKASSIVAQSRYQVQASQVELRSEIEQVLNDFRMAQLSTQAVATEQLKLAEQVRDQMNKANLVGGRPLLDVLEAQRNYRETYRIFITSRANFWRASVRLNATLGKKVAP